MWCRYRNDAMSLMHSLIKEPGLDADVVVQVGAGATMVTIRTGLNYGSSAEGQVDIHQSAGRRLYPYPAPLAILSISVCQSLRRATLSAFPKPEYLVGFDAKVRKHTQHVSPYSHTSFCWPTLAVNPW